MKTVTSEGITTMNKQTRRDAHLKMTSRFIVLLISILMVMSSTVSVLAATEAGHGGAAYAGADTNTFAAGMPLTEIYFVAEKFYGDPDEVTIVTNPQEALALEGKTMTLLGSKLTHNTEKNDVSGSYTATWKDAAILPDGTKTDVVLTLELSRVMTARSADTVPMPEATAIFNNAHSDPGVNMPVSTRTGTGVNNTNFAIAVEQNLKISVDGAGEFVVPFYGFNQNRNNAGSHAPLRTVFGNDGYDAAIETATVPDSGNVFYPEEMGARATSSSGEFKLQGGKPEQYDPPNKSGGSPGGDGSGYVAGFATIGASGFEVTINGPCGEDKGSPYANNQYVALGDLVHRIWSGSGDNGKIETYKNGTSGAKLSGGSFDGDDVTTVTGDESTLKRYVVPDAKSDVTYVMEPTEDGYFAKEVSVDGEVQKIQMDQPEGKTWTFAAGILTHLGGDKYKFVFNKPNATDHSIYVTWRTTPASDDATSIDGKGETQKGKPVFKPGGNESFKPGEYTLLDNGNPVDSITIDREGKYTIDKETGEVTFVPEPNFVGVATGVTVRATQTDDQTITAKYTPTVVETEQTKTVTRNVTFTYKTENGKTASKTVTQTLTFKRTGKYNKETGQVDYPDWEPQTFPAVKAPEIEGWTPNMAEAPALTVLDPNIKVADVHIVYNKIEGDEAGEGVDTGDDNNVKPWVAILLANAAAICALIISRRRRNA